MISIVIPLYNKSQSIANTIRCIQQQTYQDFEVVVIEGWSTDGSTELIHELAAQDTRIRVLMQQNRKGVTPARNEGVQAATYEHIAFIDADDYWEPTYLENLVKLMHDFPTAGIWGFSYGIMTGTDKTLNKSIIPAQFRGVLENPWVYGCPYWTGATGVSKSAVEHIGGFDNQIIYGEDLDLWFRLMLNFPSVYEDKVLAYYRVDAENRAMNNVIPLEKHLPFFLEKYATYRAENRDFRRYFDLQCLYRLYPYVFDKRYRKTANQLIKKIDFSLQKKSMKWRFQVPRLYRLYQQMRGRTLPYFTDYKGGRL